MLWIGLARASQGVVDHELELVLDPQARLLEVRDRLRVPEALRSEDGGVEFVLRADARPQSDAGVLEAVGAARDGVRAWRLVRPRDGERIELRYTLALGPQRRRVGLLAAGEAWLPQVAHARVRFRLRAAAPPGWTLIAPGSPWGEGGWCEAQPLEGVDLVWGRFERYAAADAGPLRLVYLLEPDAELARRYLDAARRHLDLYARLIAPHPYAKFALVENDAQTGWGFPSFTLMGSRVLRLPFIPDSAFAHEIVHDWWGNGVFVARDSGNWSEGLTTYLADYLQEEAAGRGKAFRRDALQKYADYVQRRRDMALADFRFRGDERAHAVGYHKGMMVFHMLRRRLGEVAFLEGLRRFWHGFRGREAGFEDIRRALESSGGVDLGEFFAQWVDRPGAPTLELAGARVERDAADWILRLRLRQAQDGPPYRLEVPVLVSLLGEDRARERRVSLEGRERAVHLRFARRPVYVQVDPGFDLFRRLDGSERPPSLGAVWGAERILVVLPSAASPEWRTAWEALAERWLARFPQIEIRRDDQKEPPPPGASLWIMGRDNRLLGTLAAALERRVERRMEAEGLEGAAFSVAAAGRRGGTPIAVLWASRPEALPALTRKLPHYGRYGLVAFDGSSAANRLKVQWPSEGGALDRALLPGATAAAPPPRRRLVDLAWPTGSVGVAAMPGCPSPAPHSVSREGRDP